MIFGIGTDIVKISRIQSALENKRERFPEKILGADELLVYQERFAQSQRRATLYLATRFAAKEAFAKAIGLGVRHPMNWHSLQIISGELGRPELQWQGDLALWMQERGLSAHVSLSDEDDFAVAYVIIEKNIKAAELSAHYGET
ncbi:holo-ACP synthase [Undibacterium danionis]|uniref:Holo-[acyl-carrier-protein] synthase n=1 Tax=Undibacterium danionis TaxID=1812100 RepID=A0ABV6IG36_9BURK